MLTSGTTTVGVTVLGNGAKGTNAAGGAGGAGGVGGKED